MRYQPARERHVERGAAFAQVVGGIERGQRVEVERLVGHVPRDALVDHVVVKVVVVTGRFGRLLGRGLGDRGSGTEDERAQRC